MVCVRARSVTGCPASLAATITFVSPQAEYTPPVIYSREQRARLVYLVEARPAFTRTRVLLGSVLFVLGFTAVFVSGGALFPYLESMANQAFGMVIGQGGADTMIRALTGYLKELGGESTGQLAVRLTEVANLRGGL